MVLPNTLLRNLGKLSNNCLALHYIVPNGFSLGEAEVSTRSGVVDGDGLSLDLVTPASKVSEGIDGEAHMSLEGQGVH